MILVKIMGGEKYRATQRVIRLYLNIAKFNGINKKCQSKLAFYSGYLCKTFKLTHQQMRWHGQYN